MAKLRRMVDQSGDTLGWMHRCLGCETTEGSKGFKSWHAIYTAKPSPDTGAQWNFNGNLESPTFNPSVKVTGGVNGEGSCHYFIREGRIEYQSDCAHSMAGKTVDLPDDPEL